MARFALAIVSMCFVLWLIYAEVDHHRQHLPLLHGRAHRRRSLLLIVLTLGVPRPSSAGLAQLAVSARRSNSLRPPQMP